jgi:hypothetical protein
VRRLARLLRERWERFAARTGLRMLPPVPAVLVVLALGILVPFVAKVDALPAQLAPSLAKDRLARFLAAHKQLPEAGPAGVIYCQRPAFYWPEHPGADSYTLRLYRADGTEQAGVTGIRHLFHLIRPPGGLEPGTYRYEVVAVVEGVEIPWQEHEFTVETPPEEPPRETMLMTLGPAECAYVLVGHYARLDSPHDVVSAFLHWKAARGEDPGPGSPASWLPQ